MKRDSKRTPTNTADEPHFTANANAMLGEALGGRRPGALIEGLEARGQREAVHSDTLPTEGSEDPAWAKMGVRFGEPVPGDDLFRYVELPPGWKKLASDHSMWNKLVDERGRERGSFFYKAAFYDRRAHISVDRRFSVRDEYLRAPGRGDEHVRAHATRVVVTDGGKEVFATREVPNVPEGLGRAAAQEAYAERDEAMRALRAEAEAWLVGQGFPEWRDASAYWCLGVLGLSAMRKVDEQTFRSVVAWLREFNNYAGLGSHEVDGETHYVRVDGVRKIAAESFFGDAGHGIGCGDEVFRVNESVYHQWRGASGTREIRF